MFAAVMPTYRMSQIPTETSVIGHHTGRTDIRPSRVALRFRIVMSGCRDAICPGNAGARHEVTPAPYEALREAVERTHVPQSITTAVFDPAETFS